MNNPLVKFQALLRELFQFDCADLDFGIYRIMNHKRDVVERFITEDLPAVVAAELSGGALAAQSQAVRDLELAQKKVLEALGEEVLDADGTLDERYHATKAGREYLTAKAKTAGTHSRDLLEAGIFNHLYTFFSRYYQDGDFITKRRYSKRERYAIPYNGEEVHLYWANHDQYYIKTGEYFTDYAFTVNGVTVQFKLQAADVEQNNVKGEKRFFIPRPAQMVWDETGHSLVIPFEYRPLTKQESITFGQKNQQEAILADGLEKIISHTKTQRHKEILEATCLKVKPTEGDGNQVTYLEHHLRQYTRRNTSDFFIHKDLKGFLYRELGFYLKNEVLNLDELTAAGEERAEGWFQTLRTIKAVGDRIIEFLHQIEEFQKMLWEKRKFITETGYCITVGVVPAEFYPEIVSCDAQWEEWQALFAVEEAEPGLTQRHQDTKRTDFLKAHPTLVLDTRHFQQGFVDRLLGSFDNLDDMTDGLLVHSENWQALNLLGEKYREKVTCVYIDPPYNTDASPIVYKNGYQRSSWIALMSDRLGADACLRKFPSVRCIAIDDFEYPDLIELLGSLSSECHHATACVRSKPQGRPTATGFSANHEYAIFWGNEEATIGRLPRIGSKAERYPYSDDKGVYAWANFRKSGTDSDHQDRKKSYYPVYVYKDKVRVPSMSWNIADEKWDVIENPLPKEVAIWPIDSDGREKVWTCSPERAINDIDDIRVERNAGEKIEILKKYRPNQEGALPGTWWDNSSYSASESGTKVLKDLFSAKDFDFPKSVHLVRDCLRVSLLINNGLALDYFAGSGTTGHAVINMNREDGGRRKFILIEMANYFDTVIIPRIKKVTYTPEWKNGKPKRIATAEEAERSPRIVKYIRLESYEDALNNISFDDASGQQAMQFDDYLLQYLLTWETRASETLLNVEKLTRPFAYKLQIHADGQTRERLVDIPETFSYLLGMHVKTRRVYDDGGRRYLVYRGSIDHREVAVIWRDTEGWGKGEYERDCDFVAGQKLTEGTDEVFVNGDSLIPGARALEPIFKARLFAPVE